MDADASRVHRSCFIEHKLSVHVMCVCVCFIICAASCTFAKTGELILYWYTKDINIIKEIDNTGKDVQINNNISDSIIDGLNTKICFVFPGACVREQPEIQGRQIHHRIGTYDKRQWLGLKTMLFLHTTHTNNAIPTYDTYDTCGDVLDGLADEMAWTLVSVWPQAGTALGYGDLVGICTCLSPSSVLPWHRSRSSLLQGATAVLLTAAMARQHDSFELFKRTLFSKLISKKT